MAPFDSSTSRPELPSPAGRTRSGKVSLVTPPSSTVLAAGLFLFTIFLGGCARPVEERSAHEKKVINEHRSKLNLAKEEVNDPYWQTAKTEISQNPSAITTPLTKLVRGPRENKSLLLTFDDGPHPLSTLPLLKILADEHVPATFFVIGKMAEKRPDLVRAIVRGGHTLANHTFSHVTLPNFPIEDQRTEYRANNELIEKITGLRMRFCRPPGGDFNGNTLKAAKEEGLTTVLWTDDPGDFANPGDGIVLDRTLKKLNNGGIILLHDGSTNTLDTLREFIHEARERGFTFTTPQEMVDGLRKVPSRVVMEQKRQAIERASSLPAPRTYGTGD